MAMITILNDLLDATADVDDDTDEDQALAESRSLHMKAIEALCLLERDFPLTELSIFVHEILHVPEFIYRWNSVRNYWCFATERFVGWMKKFVKNRHLSVENMVCARILLVILRIFCCCVLFVYICCISILNCVLLCVQMLNVYIIQ